MVSKSKGKNRHRSPGAGTRAAMRDHIEQNVIYSVNTTTNQKEMQALNSGSRRSSAGDAELKALGAPPLRSPSEAQRRVHGSDLPLAMTDKAGNPYIMIDQQDSKMPSEISHLKALPAPPSEEAEEDY